MVVVAGGRRAGGWEWGVEGHSKKEVVWFARRTGPNVSPHPATGSMLQCATDQDKKCTAVKVVHSIAFSDMVFTLYSKILYYCCTACSSALL